MADDTANAPRENADEKVIDESLALVYPVNEKLDAELEKRFTYHPPHPDQLPRYEALRGLGLILARLIARYTPPSREQAMALTKLEEAVSHANSAIAREPRVTGGTD